MPCRDAHRTERAIQLFPHFPAGRPAEQRILILRPRKPPRGTRLIRCSPFDSRFRRWSFHGIGYGSSLNRRQSRWHEQAETEVSAVA
jgi:hypothetical protein